LVSDIITSGSATYRKNDQDKEVDVSNIMELVPQILWYEAERRVLGRPDLVPAVALERVAILVHRAGWQRGVEVDRSWALIVPIIHFRLRSSFDVWLLLDEPQIGARPRRMPALLTAVRRPMVEAIQNRHPFP
jgi:hypothetical protein